MSDESYIKLTLEIAGKGSGMVSPDPLAGCVIVKNDKILGAGYYESFGNIHAELRAINSSSANISGATMYLNIEPCFNPEFNCVQSIIKNKISRVVIGTLDANPELSGKSVRKLLSAGIDVKVGVMEKECAELNRFYFKYIQKGLPYITLKAVVSLDGKIADNKGESAWIYSLPVRKHMHQLRTKYDAVLIGSKTVIKDNPSLTAKLTEGRNPKRIVIDPKLKLNTRYNIFNDGQCPETIIITSRENKSRKNKLKSFEKSCTRFIFSPVKNGKINLTNAMKKIAGTGITSVLVEGGRKTFSSFIKSSLYDEICIYISPKIIGDGVPFVDKPGIQNHKKSPKIRINFFERIGEDLFVELTK